MNKHASLFDNSLVEELRSSPILSDLFESIQLVAGNICNLFVNKPLTSLNSKSMQSQDFYTRVKKQIIYKSQCLDGNKVLDVLKTLNSSQLIEIGTEFLQVTARKFAKSQPIEKYAQFIYYIIQAFGLDEQYLKFFLIADRDPTEVKFFLDYISQWKIDNINEILNECTLFFLEKFALQGQIEDFKELLDLTFEYISKDFLQDTLFKLFSLFLTYALQKDFSPKILDKTFTFFQNKGLILDINTANKVLDLISRNKKDIDFLNQAIQIFNSMNIQLNLVSQNMIMDIYCNADNFALAKQIFDHLPDNGLEADSFTYSILIKGLKNCPDNKIENAMNLFRKYKRTSDNKEIVVYNSLLYLLITENEKEKVERIFDDMIKENVKPDEITFNTIIKGSCSNKDIEYSFLFFKKMKDFNLTPNRITYNSLMDLAVKIDKMDIALQLIEQMINDDITPDSFTYSIILNGLKLNNSSQSLVQNCLKNIKKVILAEEFKQDQILFNSILDVAAKYQLVEMAEDFYTLMKKKGIKESPQTATLMISVYTQSDRYVEALGLFKKMLESGMKIKEASYGLVLECCTRNDKMNLVIDMYELMKNHYFNMNSIVFTTIIKGFLTTKKYSEALSFFNTVKKHTSLPGMIITYNCALDIYANTQDIDGAVQLFNEICEHFEADLISYSTLIKALCSANSKSLALEYLKKMINSKIQIDVSVVNLFLDSCATKEDFKLAIEGYKFAMMQSIEPNEITFGIMVKVYGFARELQNAFDLLDLMCVYKISPSIIIYTNLIHISFYCREPRKAELAFTLFRKNKLDGDSLIYSKIIDGLIRFKQIKKVPKYVKYCFEEKCTLNPKTIQSILKHFSSDEMKETLEIIKGFQNQKKKPHKNVNTFVNNYNVENPRKFKQQIREQRIQIANTNLMKTDEKEVKVTAYQGYVNNKKPVALHNFRKNRV